MSAKQISSDSERLLRHHVLRLKLLKADVLQIQITHPCSNRARRGTTIR